MLRSIKNFLKYLKNSNIPTIRYFLLLASNEKIEDIFQDGNKKLNDGSYLQAIDLYQKYISFKPGEKKGYIALGYAFSEIQEWRKSADTLRKAIILDESNIDSLYMLGHACLQLGELKDAKYALVKASELQPSFEYVYGDLCLVLFQQGELENAFNVIKNGIKKFPGNPLFRFYNGNLLAECGNYYQAVVEYNVAADLGGMFPGLFTSLGAALIQIGKLEEALEVLEKAKLLTPDSPSAWSNYLLAIQYCKDITRETRFKEAQAFAAHFEDPLKESWWKYKYKKKSFGQRLRIGYVSGDFRAHALSYFFEPIIENHNKEIVEVYCYYSHPISDEVTLRLKKHADSWIHCHKMSDDELARRIRSDEIDILVDLSGHTNHNRLLAFARKPAPVQMTWLGYQATTGLKSIDYRITDNALDPINTSEKFHSEKLIRLSASGTFRASPHSPSVNNLPALSRNSFAFACLNNPSKITHEAIGLWAKILNKEPRSHLILGNSTAAMIEDISSKFMELGVSLERIVFKDKMDIADYLKLHNEIDLALDTFPYNGGTTTFHSLWMGVPIIAIEGDSTLSNVGVTIMRGLNLHQFCTNSLDQYVEKALYFSSKYLELNDVRKNLRQEMDVYTKKLSLEVTRSLEHAMRECWTEYCATDKNI
ncbi:hypothetical protein [Comamonas sp.]|uniref:O-linked N-acetylglucosamine transferase, SPINDLY family protein n=1 Tax=Comamonas sp. TaxID=34028 RepID=UPI00289AF5D7|nr:hypothetical protein [Comamonas sp.]